jgi:hypothetical protein
LLLTTHMSTSLLIKLIISTWNIS